MSSIVFVCLCFMLFKLQKEFPFVGQYRSELLGSERRLNTNKEPFALEHTINRIRQIEEEREQCAKKSLELEIKNCISYECVAFSSLL